MIGSAPKQRSWALRCEDRGLISMHGAYAKDPEPTGASPYALASYRANARISDCLASDPMLPALSYQLVFGGLLDFDASLDIWG